MEQNLKYFVYWVLLLVGLSSCSKKVTVKYTDLFLKPYSSSTIGGPYVALSIQNREEVRFIVCPSHDLKDYMIRYGKFTEEGYRNEVVRAIQKNYPLEVNDSLFNILQHRKHFVYRNYTIDSLFNKYENDFRTLLYDVLCHEKLYYGSQVIKSSEDVEWCKEWDYNYLIYILFQKGFYVYRGDYEDKKYCFINEYSEGYKIFKKK